MRPLPRISYSTARQFQRCPRQFFFRHVEGIKVPPSGAQALGLAVEAALRHGYAPLLKGGRLEPLSVVEDLFWALFREEARDAMFLEESPDQLFQEALLPLRHYWKKVAPAVLPVGLQEYGRKEIPGGVVLEGYADLVEEAGIADWKVSKRPYPIEDALPQLWTYSVLFGRRELSLHNLVRGKEALVRPISPPTPQELSYLLTSYVHIVESIDAALTRRSFPPAPPSWWCSPRWCAYYSRCHSFPWEDKERLGEAVERYRTREMFLSPEQESLEG